ncbi:DEAD/DEAH box helicase [Sphingomonadales bacterium 56]|uniref:DEAD/DEAH box helicase n=1 Tax=unclassified Sphingobium TaxID=2611147 RepID=UPI00191B20DE|nr:MULTISPECIES: DEAD/DEAH box helicase [unclassified Sphingobium]MBY2929897.1 DEAD/DEAH box helicase [Sphingomonadales bacterium 56]MBY2959854.1 DEAD/DEAH box helicase [Sphingomonadales bacterium 58]CAD7339858.1 Transcription-repair-coupling factor [Sphingobium sp. S8]CAD7340378.1 Transcription-repair-coupling factor [Sphingobium sp. S6]
MSAARGLGETALLLWQLVQEEDLLYLADDEQEAEALAAALGALAPDRPVIFLPSSDTLPGDDAPASPANIGKRVAALRSLRRLNEDADRAPLAAIMSGEAAARLYAAPEAYDAAPPSLAKGDPIDSGRFASEMEAIGYIIDDRVDEPGEVAVRGDVIDIFPADAGTPARIDIADGQISGIRRYDPVTQLTTEECERLEIGRAAEPECAEKVSILAHLGRGTIVKSPKADERRRRFVRLAAQVGKGDDAVDEDSWARAAKCWTEVSLDEPVTEVPRFALQPSPLSAMARFARPLLADGHRLLLVGSERDLRFLRPRIERKLKISLAEAASLAEARALPEHGGAALIAPIDRGAVVDGIVMIAAADLLGSRALIGEAPEAVSNVLARNGGEVRAGDVVVHEDHGVGRVARLEPAPDGSGSEVIALEYADGARRLVPVGEAGRMWRYGADADAVRLDKLDGSSWEKRRAQIHEAISESARILLEVADERARLEAAVIAPDPSRYEQFVHGFPFNETADQARAIQAVRDDLASGKPMDRLVIGDVGYGKTEVALRAAALAALAGYQVILAAPTTVLVSQHIKTFERRFADSGIKVAGLSRLSSAAEKKAVKAGLADGSVQIVIGTGAVMGKDVRYANLGLVIIDEEQRFGAADKAKLRSRADIHLLAMSATPIPRTLHRAMIGLQQISIIATPPARRQPIRTSLVEPDDNQMRTALLREKSRGGQSFVVVPRIEDIGPLCERLERIVPSLKLVTVHGKMPAAEIDRAMVDFADGAGDILLATNIIEAGLDVPRANSMIVWRADRFGLAQLHQLRGRVGRGNRRGQLMLVTDGPGIAERTMKRLRTLSTYDQLGAGFEISAADLDQRGAGDLLSDAQAGHMKLIGVDLYQHLFEAALRQARGEDPGLWLPEVNIGAAGAFPPEWIPEDDIRLGLYVRLARISDETELQGFEEEIIDRFGPMPPVAEALIASARIAILARAAHVARVDAGPAAIALTPRNKAAFDPGDAELAEKDGRWLLKQQTSDEERITCVTDLLETVARSAPPPEARGTLALASA